MCPSFVSVSAFDNYMHLTGEGGAFVDANSKARVLCSRNVLIETSPLSDIPRFFFHERISLSASSFRHHSLTPLNTHAAQHTTNAYALNTTNARPSDAFNVFTEKLTNPVNTLACSIRKFSF